MLGQPSVIARLMGMEDALPAASTMIQQVSLIIKPPPSELMHQVASKCSPLHSHHGSRINGDRYSSSSTRCLSNMKKPRHGRRHLHPQEQLLHKIKEDFHAWQHSLSSSLDHHEQQHLDGRRIQKIARENLRREKMARHGHGGTRSKVEEDRSLQVTTKHASALQQQPEELLLRGLEASHGTAMSEKVRGGGAPATTRIAVLRPTGAPGPVVLGTLAPKRDDDAVEELVQKVKERLRREMKVTGAGRDDDTKHGQKHTAGRAMARQIRDTIMAKVDMGRRLYTRSESFRVFRGDRKRAAAAAAAAAKSPERTIMKTVISSRTQACWSPEKTKRGFMASSPVTSRGRRAGAQLTDASLRCCSDLDDQHTCTGAGAVPVLSPRALVRSFSAPASSGICRALAGDTFCEGAEVTSRSRSRSRSRSFSLLRGSTPPLSSLRRTLSLGGKLLAMVQFARNKKPSSPSPQDPSPKCSSQFDAQVSDSSSCCPSHAAADDDDGFDEVDEPYCYSLSNKKAGEDHRRGRMMLLDLTSEALQLVGSPTTSLDRLVVEEEDDADSGASPSSEVADDDVWWQASDATQTVDGMVEWEVMRSPWLEVPVDDVGRKIERAILDQLVAEVAREMFV